mmetsp:Transcript_53437/g.83215  ORF Transcript_53437/g.83215 Transcript_53437/m.83215 type:complete len:171 (+) Transcript_53437:3-515(+)
MFRSDPANKDDFIRTGVWSLSRHPNYFGEITMWWGIWIAVATSMKYSIFDGEDYAASIITIISPLFTMLILLFLTGLPYAEGAALERYYKAADAGRKWDEYRLQTSPVIPIPCGLYGKIPVVVKRYFLFEFRALEYNPPTDNQPPMPTNITKVEMVGAVAEAKNRECEGA